MGTLDSTDAGRHRTAGEALGAEQLERDRRAGNVGADAAEAIEMSYPHGAASFSFDCTAPPGRLHARGNFTPWRICRRRRISRSCQTTNMPKIRPPAKLTPMARQSRDAIPLAAL